MNIKIQKQNKGFTLIEILVVMGIIAVLATIVLVAVNPARQFAQARDTQRSSNVNTLLNAIGQRTADNRGLFETGCVAGEIPATSTVIASAGYNIYPCLVPNYLPTLPVDPKIGTFASSTNYTTGYTVIRDAGTGRVTITASSTEVEAVPISVTR